MRGLARRLLPRQLLSVLTTRFVLPAMALVLAPLAVLALLRGGLPPAPADLQYPPFVAVLAASTVAFVALHLTIFRTVVGTGRSADGRDGATGLRELAQVAVLAVACFGGPGAASIWLGIGPVEALRTVTSVSLDPSTAGGPASFLYVATLLVGSYVLPVGMGAIAEGLDLREAASDRGRRLLVTHAYAKYWLGAVAVGTVGLAGVALVGSLGTVSLLAVLPIPVGAVIAKVASWRPPWVRDDDHQVVRTGRFVGASFLGFSAVIAGVVLYAPGMRQVVRLLLAALVAAVVSAAAAYLAARGYAEGVAAADLVADPSPDGEG